MIGIRQLLSYEVDEVVTQIAALVTKSDFQRKGIGKALSRIKALRIRLNE